MEKGYISVNEQEMNDVSNYLDRNSYKIKDACLSLEDKLQSMTRVGLFATGANKIGKQMTGLSGNIKTLGNNVKKHSDSVVDMENTLSNKASEIQIPKDFVKNDASQEVSYETGSLNKEDGQSINSNNEQTEIDYELNSCLEYNQKLKNIVSEYEQNEPQLKDNYVISLKDLGKLKTDSQLDIDDTLDESIIKTKTLEKQKVAENEEKELDFRKTFAALTLNKMGAEQTQQVNFSDDYDINNTILENVNIGNVQEIDPDIQIEGERINLENINNG